jgi:hypothetical protein
VPENPRLRELVDRAQRASTARAAENAVTEPLPDVVVDTSTAVSSPVSDRTPLRLVTPDRAVIETNLGRRGFWLAVAGGARQLTLPLDGEDRMGTFTVEPGPRGPLTVLELEVVTWLCSRWREHEDQDVREVPVSLSSLASDFSWSDSGTNLRRLTLALDRLTDAAVTAEVWAPGEKEARLRRRFHLLEGWQIGDPDRAGRLRRTGSATIGDWLLGQLRGGHHTFLDWTTLRALDRPLAKRLYTFLEVERFDVGAEKRWAVDGDLFGLLGQGQGNPRDARTRLAGAAAEVQAVASRYRSVVVEPRRRGRGHVLVAVRRTTR